MSIRAHLQRRQGVQNGVLQEAQRNAFINSDYIMHRFDFVDAFAVLLLAIGTGLMAWGIVLEPPGSLKELVLTHFGDWTPGFLIDGLLLLVLNRVIHNHERKRVISQVASLSNEFALDAVRRCRDDGWLRSGIMAKGRFAKARLANADLSDAKLPGSDLSFADLSGADLTHANLQGASLTGANLSMADLRWSNLTGADLQWSDLRDAQLDGAVLDSVKADFASIDAEHESNPEFRHAVVGGILSAHQVELLTISFNQLMAHGDSAIVNFYNRLFEVAPDVRRMFKQDVDRQARKFLQTLRVIVTSLISTEKAAPVLQRLGERHLEYGAETSHYDVVGAVLIDTFSEVLGEKFTDEMRDAWAAAFELISSVMRSASRESRSPIRALLRDVWCWPRV